MPLSLALSSEFCIGFGGIKNVGAQLLTGQRRHLWEHIASSLGLAVLVMNILGTWDFGKFPEPSNTETMLTSIVLLTGYLLMTWTIILLCFVTTD